MYINGYRTGLKEDIERLIAAKNKTDRTKLFLKQYYKLEKSEQIICGIILDFLDLGNNKNITFADIIKEYDKYYTPDKYTTVKDIKALRIEIINKLQEIELK